MCKSTPSASEIATEKIRQELVDKLRLKYPTKHKEYIEYIESKKTLKTVLIVIVLISGLLSITNDSIWPMVAGIIILFIICLFSPDLTKSSEILNNFEREIFDENEEKNQIIKKIGEIMSEKDALIFGDKIIAHPGATIINRSVVIDSFNVINKTNEELALALKTLAGFIEHSKNLDAAEVYTDLAEELKGNARPSRLRSYWNEIARILPDVLKLTNAVTAITKMFA